MTIFSALEKAYISEGSIIPELATNWQNYYLKERKERKVILFG